MAPKNKQTPAGLADKYLPGASAEDKKLFAIKVQAAEKMGFKPIVEDGHLWMEGRGGSFDLRNGLDSGGPLTGYEQEVRRMAAAAHIDVSEQGNQYYYVRGPTAHEQALTEKYLPDASANDQKLFALKIRAAEDEGWKPVVEDGHLWMKDPRSGASFDLRNGLEGNSGGPYGYNSAVKELAEAHHVSLGDNHGGQYEQKASVQPAVVAPKKPDPPKETRPKETKPKETKPEAKAPKAEAPKPARPPAVAASKMAAAKPQEPKAAKPKKHAPEQPGKSHASRFTARREPDRPVAKAPAAPPEKKKPAESRFSRAKEKAPEKKAPETPAAEKPKVPAAEKPREETVEAASPASPASPQHEGGGGGPLGGIFGQQLSGSGGPFMQIILAVIVLLASGMEGLLGQQNDGHGAEMTGQEHKGPKEAAPPEKKGKPAAMKMG